MTLQQLHYILTIAEKGSMNKAAELLYVSQSNLTSAVKELARYDADVSDFLPAAIIPDFKARMMEQI